MELTLLRTMRGEDKKQSSMLVLMSPESRVPQGHPLRAIKKLADEALRKLSPVFDAMYAEGGRPSIPPERLLKSMLLMALYTVRSERLFCEQLDYNLLFRWFLDMDMVEDSFVPTVFSHNRDRLIVHDVAGEFLRAVVEQARGAKLMSADHFTVDGTLIESWASLKSFKKNGHGICSQFCTKVCTDIAIHWICQKKPGCYCSCIDANVGPEIVGRVDNAAICTATCAAKPSSDPRFPGKLGVCR